MMSLNPSHYLLCAGFSQWSAHEKKDEMETMRRKLMISPFFSLFSTLSMEQT